MGISVAQIEMQFSEKLSIRLRAGRNGLNKKIEKMAVMETKDFAYGAEPKGMFVLSTLSFIGENGEGVDAVLELLDKKPTAMAIKINRYVEEIPIPILNSANENEVPIFEIYSNVMFSDFISIVSEALVLESNIGRSNRKAVDTLFLSRRVANESIKTIVEFLGRLFGISCFFIDLESKLLGCYKTPDFSFRGNLSTVGEKMIEMSLTVDRKKYCFYDDNIVVFPCFVGNNLLGVLVFLDTEAMSEEIEDIVLQSMSHIAVRMCEKRIGESNILLNRGQVLLDEVLFKSVKDPVLIKNQLKNGGFNILECYAFIIVSVESECIVLFGSSIMEYCRVQLLKCFEHCLIKMDNNTLKCLVTFSDEEASKQNRVLNDRLMAFRNSTFAINGHLINIGFSLIQDNLSELTQSFLQAQAAINLGKMYRPEKHVYDYKSFCVQGLIFRSRDSQEYKWLLKNVVDPISTRDRLYESGLWDSLTVLFKARSLKIASEELHIHISTLRYRLQKIKDVTGFDYLSVYGNYVLHTAYLIWMDTQTQ